MRISETWEDSASLSWPAESAGWEEPARAIDGFTSEQRFFLNWAQVWRDNMRDEALRVRLKTDPHSPSKYRANGPLSNMGEFAGAFGCSEGDAMVRPAGVRARIW